MKKWIILAVAVAFGWAGLALADGHYLKEDAIPLTLIPPPPGEGSAQWLDEIEHIKVLQRAPDNAALQRAEAEIKMRAEMVADMLPGLTRTTYPATFKLLDNIKKDSRVINHAAKAYYNTKRPYVVSDEIEALIAAHNNPAYPSGHTMGAMIWAEVLGQLLPEHAALLRDRAAEIAEHRVLTGMHYPADLDGGRALAYLTLGALWQSEVFLADLAAAKAELAAHPLP